ncbi:MAG: type IV secretion system DNA-binding domain-containing protein, partial [Bdellovibrionales bacterium]|nr:type IV secretion system DNA-binding domain-containing protein [Bdellovibrionales bacterium]
TMIPSAEIVEGEDFTEAVSEDDIIVSQELGIAEPKFPALPFLTYDERQHDCAGPYLNVLSVLPPEHKYMIQFVAKKIPDNWMLSFRYRMQAIAWLAAFPFRPLYWFKPAVMDKFKEYYPKKMVNPTFNVNIRAAVVVPGGMDLPDEDRIKKEKLAKQNLKSIVTGLTFTSNSQMGRIRAKKVKSGLRAIGPMQDRSLKKPFFFDIFELGTLWHPVFVTKHTNVAQVMAEHGSPPSNLIGGANRPDVTLFGRTNFRKGKDLFGIQRVDRDGHLHILGKSGTGKSKLIELLAQSDMKAGFGLALLDCHGDLVDEVLRLVPEERVKDVAVFDVSDYNFPPSFNPFSQVLKAERQFLAAEFIDMFKKVDGLALSESAERVLQNVVLALMEVPDTTVLSIFQMLTDADFRAGIVSELPEGAVRDFWMKEMDDEENFLDQPDIFRLTKVISRLVSTNLISCVLGQVENKFDFSRMIEENKIILIKVPKKNLGKQNTVLLGTLILTMIRLAASARADRGSANKQFYIYVDEFQNFATESFAKSLTNASKHKVSYTIAHQMINQLPAAVKEALTAKVSNVVSFQVGSDDAAALESRFSPPFSRLGLMNLDLRDFYIRMAIDGNVQEAFSGRTIDVAYPEVHYAKKCIEQSRNRYARVREEVLEELLLHDDDIPEAAVG